MERRSRKLVMAVAPHFQCRFLKSVNVVSVSKNTFCVLVKHILGPLHIRLLSQYGSSLRIRQAGSCLAEQAGDVPHIQRVQHSRRPRGKTLWQRLKMLKSWKVTMHTMQSRPVLLARLPKSGLVISQGKLCAFLC